MHQLLILLSFLSIYSLAEANVFSDFRLVVAKCIKQIKEEAENLVDERMSSGCGCANYSCGCCAHIEQAYLHLNDTGCLNFTYLPEEFGISVKFTLDGIVEYKGKASARNPPPLCFGLPRLISVGMCIKFYNLSVANHTFSGCIQLQLKGVVHENYDIGCFKLHFPRSGYQLVEKSAMKLLHETPTNNLLVVAKKNPDTVLRFRPEKRIHKAFNQGPQIFIN